MGAKSKFLKYMIIFAFIPLILSIGIIPAISFGEMIDSPRKQMKNGIASEDVVCKSGFTLMLRPSGSAVCVKPSTAEKLDLLGWVTIQKETTMIKETAEPYILTSDDCIEQSTGLTLVEDLAGLLALLTDTEFVYGIGLFALNEFTCPSDDNQSAMLERVFAEGFGEILAEMKKLPYVTAATIELDKATTVIETQVVDIVPDYQDNQCKYNYTDDELFISLTESGSSKFLGWDPTYFLNNVVHPLDHGYVQELGIGNYAMGVNLYIAMLQQTALVDPDHKNEPNKSRYADYLKNQLYNSINHTTTILQELRDNAPVLENITDSTIQRYGYPDVDYSWYAYGYAIADEFYQITDCSLLKDAYGNWPPECKDATNMGEFAQEVSDINYSYQESLENQRELHAPINHLNATVTAWQHLYDNGVVPISVQDKRVCDDIKKNSTKN